MNPVLIVCVVLVTLALIVAVIFAVQTLVQIRRASREAEILLKHINEEVNTVLRITGSISAFIDGLSSPWVKMGSWFTGVASILLKKKKKE
jgi:uncharacterized protein YoxC